jgi:hypothetical protein
MKRILQVAVLMVIIGEDHLRRNLRDYIDDAIEIAIRGMREGEIAVIFYERPGRITKALRRHSAATVTTYDFAHGGGQ